MKKLFQKMISLFRSLFKKIKFKHVFPLIMIWLIFDLWFICNTIEDKIFVGITMIFLMITEVLIVAKNILNIVTITAKNTVIIYEEIAGDELTQEDLDSALMNALKSIKENETIYKKSNTDTN